MEIDFVVFSSPPMDIISVVEDDCCGLYVNRLCPELVFLFSFNAASCSTQKKI